MHGKITIGIVLLSLILILAACSGVIIPGGLRTGTGPGKPHPGLADCPAPVTLCRRPHPLPQCPQTFRPYQGY